MKAVESSTMTS